MKKKLLLKNQAPTTKGVLIFKFPISILTDGIFETGAYGVPSKSQNPTIVGSLKNSI